MTDPEKKMMPPTLKQIQKRILLLTTSLVSFDGIVFRSSTPKYANDSDLVSGTGSKLHGQRWNPAGIAVLYASLTPEAAMAETLAHYRYYEIPIEEAMPRVFVGIQVKVGSILDLRAADTVRRLGVSKQRLLKNDWRREVSLGHVPLTQQVGLAAYNSGLEGLLVPSAAEKSGTNLLLFPDNFSSDLRVSVRGISK